MKRKIFRKCVFNNEILPIDELIRIVCVDNVLLIDKDYIIKGRGFYIKNNSLTKEKLFQGKLLEKLLRKLKWNVTNLVEFKEQLLNN